MSQVTDTYTSRRGMLGTLFAASIGYWSIASLFPDLSEDHCEETSTSTTKTESGPTIVKPTSDSSQATPITKSSTPKIGETVSLNVTAYCSCVVCTGPSSPEIGGHGLTASGHLPVEGRTVAADWSILPKGTKLVVPGFGVLKVEDTGSAIKGYKLDIYMESHEEAKQFGRKNLKVRIA